MLLKMKHRVMERVKKILLLAISMMVVCAIFMLSKYGSLDDNQLQQLKTYKPQLLQLDHWKDTPTCNIESGNKRVIYPASKSPSFATDLGKAEDSIEHFLLNMLGNVDTRGFYGIDVGANNGQFANILLSLGLRTFSFEPFKSTCDIFRSNMKTAMGLGRLKLYCGAVGDSSGKAYFEVKKSGASQSFKVATKKKEGRSDLSYILTDKYSLDETILPQLGQQEQVAFFKTDTQGYERYVLEGAHELLKQKKVNYVLIEMSNGLLKSYQSTVPDILELMYSHGYTCSYMNYLRTMNPEKTAGMQVEPETLKKSEKYNDFNEVCYTFEEYQGLLKEFSAWSDILCFITDLEL